MCSHLWKVAQDMVIPCRIDQGAGSPLMLAGEQSVSLTPVKEEVPSTDESISIDDSMEEDQ